MVTLFIITNYSYNTFLGQESYLPDFIPYSFYLHPLWTFILTRMVIYCSFYILIVIFCNSG